MKNQTDYIHETFAKLQDIVTTIASLSQVNAMLSNADPALVLPTPAAGLLELKSEYSCSMPPTTMMAPVDGYAVGDDLIFTVLSKKTEVHPWQIINTEWLPAKNTDNEKAYYYKGVRLNLKRDPASLAKEGWLNLAILDDIGLIQDFGNSRAYVDNERLKMRRCPLVSDLKNFAGFGNHSIVNNVTELNRNLIQIKLPNKLGKQSEFSIDLCFDESLPVALAQASPVILSNVCMIWNCVECEYPDISDIEQRISETEYRLIHPLINHRLGAQWSAWLVKNVYSSNESNPNSGIESTANLCVKSKPSRLEYSPVLVPIDEDGDMITKSTYVSSAGITLAIAITPRTGLYLDTRSAHLKATYFSTTGSHANGLSNGTRFAFESMSSNNNLADIDARLVGHTWGGSDGFGKCLIGTNDIGGVYSVLQNRPRKVRDLLKIFDRFYGEFMKIADPFDLIRQSDSLQCEQLIVRIKFIIPPNNKHEKESMLKSCESFLRRYLALNRSCMISLIEDNDYEG
jgi:hypothetical protein